MTIDIPNNGRVVKNRQDVCVKRTHLELFERLAATPPTDPRTLKKSLLVLSTPRSGSTMFCDALNSTNELGFCDEWFNYEYFAAYLIVNKIELFNLKDYMTWVAERTIRNGTYCLKWHVGQVESMAKDFNVDINAMHFDHVIWLYRRDILGQAVSLAKALATDKFRSYEDGNGKSAEELVDNHSITSALSIVQSKYRYFYAHLSHLVDVQVAYEDVCNLKHPVYSDTLQAMGRKPVEPVGTSVKRQRDDVTKRLVDCYKDYLADIMEIHDAYN